MNFQKELNRLAEEKSPCRIHGVSGTAILLRYEPLLESIGQKKGAEFLKNWIDTGQCYLFEVGYSYGHVFGAALVERLEFTKLEVVIYLKQ